MTLHLDRLPRALALLEVGELETSALSNAAAELVAAFISEQQLPEGSLVLVCLDQRALPVQEVFLCTVDWRPAVRWIQELVVRGAPVIGAAGACALALAAHELACKEPTLFMTSLEEAASVIGQARPTAVNLAWAVEHSLKVARMALAQGASPDEVADALYQEALVVMAEDEAMNRAMGAHGAALLPEGCAVLTHCNAGSLATSFYGTALGVIYAAVDAGKVQRVYADETRPVCQGSRLTAWELAQAGVPVTLICDDMAASVMASGKVSAVIVGADRIAANGDTANKIGTLGVAVLAQHFNIPFYVAAPTSTIDAHTLDGNGIPIEERSAQEVLPELIQGVDVFNPAFDVTPASLITAIITERGVFAPDDIASALR